MSPFCFEVELIPKKITLLERKPQCERSCRLHLVVCCVTQLPRDDLLSPSCANRAYFDPIKNTDFLHTFSAITPISYFNGTTSGVSVHGGVAGYRPPVLPPFRLYQQSHYIYSAYAAKGQLRLANCRRQKVFHHNSRFEHSSVPASNW